MDPQFEGLRMENVFCRAVRLVVSGSRWRPRCLAFVLLTICADSPLGNDETRCTTPRLWRELFAFVESSHASAEGQGVEARGGCVGRVGGAWQGLEEGTLERNYPILSGLVLS